MVTQRLAARAAHRPAPAAAGKPPLIAVIAGPADPCGATLVIPRLVPRHGGIEVAAQIDDLPVDPSLGRIGVERGSVEPPRQGQRARARRAVERIDLEEPARLVAAFDRKLDEHRAFPHFARRTPRADVRQMGPVPKIGRGVERGAMVEGTRHDHDPAARRFMPEDIGIAKIAQPRIENGIAVRLDETQPRILADRKMLRLARAVDTGRGEQGDEPSRAEPGAALRVECHAPREEVMPLVAQHRGRQVAPVDQIGRAGVAPRHVAPILVMRIMLIIKVPQPVGPDEAVGIAQPVRGRGYMIAGAVDHDESGFPRSERNPAIRSISIDCNFMRGFARPA